MVEMGAMVLTHSTSKTKIAKFLFICPPSKIVKAQSLDSQAY
jgi:hypothetical protein